ncbi:hypothetical protein BGZ63DRAFT_395894 [Mariannaea sp. PMI_226]|nr:hypothetical protein BGZ63DRAFT_395894 [Mariannaea sp. PMI_226]
MAKQSGDIDFSDDSPPPYSPAAAPQQPFQSVSSLLSSHLRNLPDRISSTRAARTSEREERDAEILPFLIPHIEDLIHSVAVMDPPPSRLEMTMIPADAVEDSWRFSDEDDNHRLVKIQTASSKNSSDVKKEKSGLGLSTGSKTVFDEWGRWEDGASSSSNNKEGALWWHDDEMAYRLAKYLQPERPHPKASTPPVPEPQPAKKSTWSMFKKSEPAPVPPRLRIEEEPVSLTVRAEEVTFRRENEFGIWETKTGWGLVVRIRVRQ